MNERLIDGYHFVLRRFAALELDLATKQYHTYLNNKVQAMVVALLLF